jgi:hypothetical protein
MLQAVAHVGVGLQVKDPVAALDRIVEHGRIEHVAVDEPDSWPPQCLGDKLRPPGAEVVHDHDLDAFSAQPVSQIAADEPGATGDAGTLHRADQRLARRRKRVPGEALCIG